MENEKIEKSLSADDIKLKMSDEKKALSIDLVELLKISSNEQKLKCLIRNSINVTSKETPELADLLSNLIHVAHSDKRHHKNKNQESMKKAQSAAVQLLNDKALEIYPMIQKLESEGLNNHLIAQALNKAEILTPRGKTDWQHISVKRLKERIEKIDLS